MIDEPAPETVLSAAMQVALNSDEESRLRGAVVTGWVCVVEIMDGNGDRYLKHYRPDSTPIWTASGMAQHFLADTNNWEEDEAEGDA